jgi:acetyl-CoA acyltransferase
MKEMYGVDSMPETAENVADRIQDRARGAGPHGAGLAAEGGGGAEGGFFDAEITPVTIAQKKGDPIVVAKDEHPRETSSRRWPS